jgi:hypothetical protein
MARGKGRFPEWSAWIQDQLEQRGWLPPDLVRASGGTLVNKTVYNWMAGTNGISSAVAVTVAKALGVNLEDVLYAGGHNELADEVAALRESSSQHPGTTPEPVDDVVAIVLARKDLTAGEQADAIAYFRLRKERAVAETLALVDAMLGRRDNDATTG